MNDKAYLSILFVISIISVVFLYFGFVITPAAKANPFKFSQNIRCET